MKILVILAHPVAGSFNHAVAEAAVTQLRGNGHQVSFHDLYREGFDPLLVAEEIASGAALPPQIAAHCEEVRTADGLIMVHPNWWGQPPAILTGWVDRVMRPGVAYNFLGDDNGEGIPLGLLKVRTAIVLNTSNTPARRESSTFGDPLDLIWKRCIFGLCGVEDVRRIAFSVVVTSSPEQRERWLAETRELVDACFPPPHRLH